MTGHGIDVRRSSLTETGSGTRPALFQMRGPDQPVIEPRAA